MNNSTIIGFTGSRMGMTQSQRKVFTITIRDRIHEGAIQKFVHGGAIGADENADLIVSQWGIPIVVRPASNDRCLFWIEKGDGIVRAVHSVELPLERNRQIVESVREMIATPAQMKEMQRSGTWMTIRHSRRKEVPVTIIYPDGTLGQ
jgi:hypothetical protein